MKKIILISLFSITVIAQWLVPLQMIWHEEDIITQGKIYKFKTQPIDPTDPFRGKYITLNYELNQYVTKDTSWYGHTEAYVYLKNDSLGFAAIDQVSKVKLEQSTLDYIKVEDVSFYEYSQTLHFDFPFNRFYMEEHKAKPAESIVSRRRRENDSILTYAKVAVKDGRAALIDVMVNDMSIADFVEQMGDE